MKYFEKVTANCALCVGDGIFVKFISNNNICKQNKRQIVSWEGF